MGESALQGEGAAHHGHFSVQFRVLPGVPVGELVGGGGEGLVVEIAQSPGAGSRLPFDLAVDHFFSGRAARLKIPLKIQWGSRFFQDLR